MQPESNAESPLMAVEPVEAPPRRTPVGVAWTPLAVAAAALAALIALVAGRTADPVAAIVAAAMVLAVGVGLSLWVRDRPQASAEPLSARPAGGALSGALVASYAVLEALEDPVLVVSGEEPDDIAGRRLIYANAAARELFRTSREAGPLVTAVRDPKVLDTVDEALFGGVSGEASYAAGGVQDRVWKARARPLKGVGGQRLALLTLRDETELRRSERTRADFLANASHELRTPLASLTGFIETLRGHARDDVVARDRFLAIMHDQADRMARLIDDLLSLSRIELNAHRRPDTPVDLVPIVRQVADGLQTLARDRGVTVHIDAANAIRVPGDRDELVRVFENLVENALKYGAAGKRVDIGFSEGESPEGEQEARISVRDYGPGIAPEHVPRLTERFYRVDVRESRAQGGTGLGLALVKHILNRHHGRLLIESMPGAGATFTIYLPLAVGVTTEKTA